ncbi:MAG: F-box protein, partial [Candidatus Amoebophilus sp.]
MLQQLFVFFVVTVLLPSCHTKPMVTDKDDIRPAIGKRKRIEVVNKSQKPSDKRSKTVTENDFAASIGQSPIQELTENDISTLSVMDLIDEVMLQVFNELAVRDIVQASEVCKHWQALTEEPALWKALRLRIHGDYSPRDTPKEQVKKHMLRVRVNMLSDFTIITHLVDKYKLNDDHPFKIYQDLFIKLFYRSNLEMVDDYAAQGNEEAIRRKIEGLAYGMYGYNQNAQAATLFNDILVEQDNQKAIERKIEGLVKGNYGYTRDTHQLRSWIEHQAANGKRWACYLKAQGLKYGILGL